MAATSYCASLGMRLPSVKESLTILDFTQSVSTGWLIDRTAFTKLGSGFWWTSSVDLSQYMSAWSLDVEDGGLAAGNYYGGATETHCIR